MRISDWSSDVCSSDLRQHTVRNSFDTNECGYYTASVVSTQFQDAVDVRDCVDRSTNVVRAQAILRHHMPREPRIRSGPLSARTLEVAEVLLGQRSEEHRVGKEG